LESSAEIWLKMKQVINWFEIPAADFERAVTF
jgi:predicted enzyme related to lactoylglutathione lyase